MTAAVESLVTRNRVPSGAWDSYVLEHPDGWWFHSVRWLDYALEYTPGSVDVSLAALDGAGRVIGVAPAIMTPAGKLVNGGQTPVHPLGECAGVVSSGSEYACRPRPDGSGEQGTFVVDLRVQPELWTNLRHSYRSLIYGAQKSHEIVVLNTASPSAAVDSAVSSAMHVHATAAGRITRSPRTWQMQSRWLQDGRALLALACRDGCPRGFAYAIRWKGWSYYASGAALDRNVQHALIWNLILELANDGETAHFEIGHDAAPDADEKARGIAFFKSGFGGDRWTFQRVRP